MERKRWHCLSELVTKYKCKHIAEIGVHRGRTSYEILRRCPEIVKYYAIDPWSTNKGYTHWTMANHRRGEQLFARHTVHWPDKVVKMKTYSAEAVTQFEPNSLDLVFIDADHSYESCREDIELWLPKIKVSGIISGHDYHHPMFPGVTQAVDEIFPAINTDKDHVWWVKL